MHSTGDQQSKKNTGIATGKRNVRRLFEEQCDTIASVVGAYAIDTKNTELEERIATNVSKLQAKAGAKLLSYGRQLQQELITYKDGLTEFSITPELTAAFDELLEEFAVQVAAPSNATATRKVQGKKLKELVKQNNFIHKKQMRPVAKLFKKSHPWFYAEYMECSKNKNPKTSHSRASGIITDSSTGKTIYGVTVSVEGTAYTATSSRSGLYKLPIEKGNYTLLVSKEGYEPVRIPATEINPGETTWVHVKMIPKA